MKKLSIIIFLAMLIVHSSFAQGNQIGINPNDWTIATSPPDNPLIANMYGKMVSITNTEIVLQSYPQWASSISTVTYTAPKKGRISFRFAYIAGAGVTSNQCPVQYRINNGNLTTIFSGSQHGIIQYIQLNAGDKLTIGMFNCPSEASINYQPVKFSMSDFYLDANNGNPQEVTIPFNSQVDGIFSTADLSNRVNTDLGGNCRLSCLNSCNSTKVMRWARDFYYVGIKQVGNQYEAYLVGFALVNGAYVKQRDWQIRSSSSWSGDQVKDVNRLLMQSISINVGSNMVYFNGPNNFPINNASNMMTLSTYAMPNN